MNSNDHRNEPFIEGNNEATIIPATETTSTWRPQDADRESYKASIRQRVQSAKVTEGTVFLPAKPKPTINDSEEKNVAVYARVSTKSTEQVSSIENQTKYYTEKINKTPNWTMQGIYSDEGKSGTSMKKRDAFKRMLLAASENKMDLILCASVSRFARNVSDCIEQVRILRTQNPSHPVGVYFETENIYTLDPESHQLLTIHAMLADWESANKSRRMILSYDQRICTGQYPVSDLLGYRHTRDGDLIIHEEEAKTVRFIFLARNCGYSYAEIAEILTEKARPTLHGRTDWNVGMVRNILSNERRWGALSARKTIVIDYKEKKTVKNNRERDAAYATDHHVGIVSPEIAKATQLVAASRGSEGGVRDIGVIAEGSLKGFVSIYPAWSGIDNKMFYSVSRSVYSDEEYAHLEQVGKIISGECSSNILSLQLTGYEVPPSAYFITRNTPTLTFSARQIRLSNSIHKRLGYSKFVEMLYHPILQTVIIRSCNEDAYNAICLEKKNGSRVTNINAPAFAGAIYEKMNWIENYSFKFRGVYRERGSTKAIIFYLDEPQILLEKGSENLISDPLEEDRSSCFIPYKNSVPAAYPKEWKNRCIGISYEMRRYRDRTVDELTASDISQESCVVENPLIGKIPNRQETLDEIQQLLESM